jgi:hypothetical protein
MSITHNALGRVMATVICGLLVATTSAQAQTPDPTPSPTSAAPVPPALPASSNTAKATSLLVLCGFNIDAMQASVDTMAKDGSQLAKLGAVLVVGTIISETLGVVNKPAPAKALTTTWSRCKRVMETVRTAFRDWYNDELATDAVADALKPARAELKLMYGDVLKIGRAERYSEAQIQAHAQQVLDQMKANFAKIGG